MSITKTPTAIKPLTDVESAWLEDLEKKIAENLKGFIAVGRALRTIRLERLYREAFTSFEDYIVERWEFSRQHAYRLIEAFEIREDLSPIGDTFILPSTESQVRPLARLKPEQRNDAWARVVDLAPEVDGIKHVTAKLVDKVVREMRGDELPMAPPTTDEPELLPLAVALQSLNDAVMGLREQWPVESLDLMATKLRRLADEIDEEVAKAAPMAEVVA